MMTTARIIAALVLLGMTGLGLYLFFDSVPEEVIRPPAGSPFESDAATADTRREPTRDPGARRRIDEERPAVEAEEIRPELPRVRTRDDFGRLEASLLVQVRDREAEPLAGAEVELFECYQGGGYGLKRGPALGLRKTGADGEVRFEGLEVVSTFELFVRHPDHRRYRCSPLALEPGRYQVQLVVLGEGLTMRGRVIEKESRQPVVGAEVVLYDLGDQSGDPEGAEEARTRTDAQGEYTIENLSAGNKRALALAPGLGGSTKPYFSFLPDSAARTVDFELSRGESISGQVLEPDGRPIAGAEVKARPVGGQAPEISSAFIPAVRTDARGRYTVDGLQAGHYFLRAERAGYAEGNFSKPGEARKASMRNAEAGDVGIDLYLGQGPTVSGRVLDAQTGEPVTVFDLYADGLKDPFELDLRRRQRVNDAQGRFTYAVPVLGSQARHVWLHARAPGYAGGATLVDFSQGGKGLGPLTSTVDRVEIKLEKGGEIAGRVRASSGGALAGVRVTAKRLRDRETVPNSVAAHIPVPDVFKTVRGAVSDEEGRYVLENLGEGRYLIEFQHEDFARAVHPDELLFSGIGRLDLPEQSLTRGGRVFGQVVDAEGHGAEGARVSLASSDSRLGKSFEFRTGISGAFRFDRVPAGSYTLMVTERDGLDTRSALYREWKKREPNPLEIEVFEGMEESFKLEP